ncbi:MAG: hypothetical protein Q4A60_09380 [Pasteurellaceae bacterium]|nr:hypothetical protein [Pasteurellaceae bacterium]
MNAILSKTFGGLSASYYIRQFLFGLIFASALAFPMFNGDNTIRISALLVICINQFLYPYSRFVYESIIEYILGDNIIIGNAIIMLIIKIITMALCWGLAVFIAPIGLIYLYFYHSKQEKLEQQNNQ